MIHAVQEIPPQLAGFFGTRPEVNVQRILNGLATFAFEFLQVRIKHDLHPRSRDKHYSKAIKCLLRSRDTGKSVVNLNQSALTSSPAPQAR